MAAAAGLCMAGHAPRPGHQLGPPELPPLQWLGLVDGSGASGLGSGRPADLSAPCAGYRVLPGAHPLPPPDERRARLSARLHRRARHRVGPRLPADGAPGADPRRRRCRHRFDRIPVGAGHQLRGQPDGPTAARGPAARGAAPGRRGRPIGSPAPRASPVLGGDARWPGGEPEAHQRDLYRGAGPGRAALAGPHAAMAGLCCLRPRRRAADWDDQRPLDVPDVASVRQPAVPAAQPALPQ